MREPATMTNIVRTSTIYAGEPGSDVLCETAFK